MSKIGIYESFLQQKMFKVLYSTIKFAYLYLSSLGNVISHKTLSYNIELEEHYRNKICEQLKNISHSESGKLTQFS